MYRPDYVCKLVCLIYDDYIAIPNTPGCYIMSRIKHLLTFKIEKNNNIKKHYGRYISNNSR